MGTAIACLLCGIRKHPADPPASGREWEDKRPANRQGRGRRTETNRNTILGRDVREMTKNRIQGRHTAPSGICTAGYPIKSKKETPGIAGASIASYPL